MIKLVALVGEAGTGKDSILHGVMALYPNKFHEIISYTTRPPREGEQDGINYHFVTEEEFNKLDLLESSSFNGWHYGTAKSSLVEDKINIGVFNPQGIYSILGLQYDYRVCGSLIRITCNNKTRLLRQLNREGSPNVDEIIRRYGTDKKDFEEFDKKITWCDVLANETPYDLARNVNLIGQIH